MRLIDADALKRELKVCGIIDHYGTQVLIKIDNTPTIDALHLLKAQEPRVMTMEEVEALPYGYVLVETDKSGSLRWLDALLFCKNMNFSFDIITLEGRARLLGAEYNREWRCWTSRPTDEKRAETPWDC